MTRPYMNAGEVLAAYSEIPPEFFEVLDTEWNAKRLQSVNSDVGYLRPGDETTTEMTVTFEFENNDDARAFGERCVAYGSNGEGGVGENGLHAVHVRTTAAPPRPPNYGLWTTPRIETREPPTVVCDFAGDGYYSERPGPQYGPMCVSFVNFAHALLADRLENARDVKLTIEGEGKEKAFMDKLRLVSDDDSGGGSDADEADAPRDPETCPECESTATVGFSTGDRVCRACNHNWEPEEDE